MVACSELSGYRVYALHVGGAVHHLYARHHQATTLPDNSNTLFVANIPPVFDEVPFHANIITIAIYEILVTDVPVSHRGR